MSMSLRKQIPERKGLACLAPASRPHTRSANALTIPAIHSTVPYRMSTPDIYQPCSKVALSFLDHINDYSDTDPLRLAEIGVSNWLNECIGDLSVFDLQFVVSRSIEDAFGYQNEGEPSSDGFYLSIMGGGTDLWSLASLDDLDKHLPGLSTTAWQLLSEACYRTFGLTPSVASESIASWFWWREHDTDAALIEELTDDGMDLEEVADMPTITWWESQYPVHVRKPERALSEKVLLEQAQTGHLEVREACRMLAEVASYLRDKRAFVPGIDANCDYRPAHYGVALTPARKDDIGMNRLRDDWYFDANNNGDAFCDAMSITHMPFDRMALRRLKVSMSKGFQLLGALDRFIATFGTATD